MSPLRHRLAMLLPPRPSPPAGSHCVRAAGVGGSRRGRRSSTRRAADPGCDSTCCTPAPWACRTRPRSRDGMWPGPRWPFRWRSGPERGCRGRTSAIAPRRCSLACAARWPNASGEWRSRCTGWPKWFAEWHCRTQRDYGNGYLWVIHIRDHLLLVELRLVSEQRLDERIRRLCLPVQYVHWRTTGLGVQTEVVPQALDVHRLHLAQRINVLLVALSIG